MLKKLRKTHKLHRYNKKLVLVSILVLLIFILLLTKFKSMVLFLIIVIAAGVLNYFIHIMDFHIHIGHVAFIMIVFSYVLNFKFGILVIILAHIIPEILAGHADTEMLVSAGVYTLIAYLASVFNTVPIMRLGIILSVVNVFLTSIIESVTGTPIFELISENGIELFMLVLYFTSIAEFLVFIIK